MSDDDDRYYERAEAAYKARMVYRRTRCLCGNPDWPGHCPGPAACPVHGARDVIAATRLAYSRHAVGDMTAAAILAAPEAVRLELARALVKAEGWRVIPPPAPLIHDESTDYEQSFCDGWNACRAAVLASEGGDNG